jgi:hypothetical protein
MSQFKRPNDILAASSGFDHRSTTISVSSRILEIAEGLPTIQSEPRVTHFISSTSTQRAIVSATCASSPVYSWSPFTIIADAIFGESPASP